MGTTRVGLKKMQRFLLTSLLFLTGMRQQTGRKLRWKNFEKKDGKHYIHFVERKTNNLK